MSNACVKEPDLHLRDMLSSYPLSVFKMRGKHARDLLAFVVSALSLKVYREAAPSTTLATYNNSGSNYRHNHFITSSTIFLCPPSRRSHRRGNKTLGRQAGEMEKYGSIMVCMFVHTAAAVCLCNFSRTLRTLQTYVLSHPLKFF